MNLPALPDRHGYDLSAKKPRRWRARTKAVTLLHTTAVQNHSPLQIFSLNLLTRFLLLHRHQPPLSLATQCPHRRNIPMEVPKRRLTTRHIWIRRATWEWI